MGPPTQKKNCGAKFRINSLDGVPRYRLESREGKILCGTTTKILCGTTTEDITQYKFLGPLPDHGVRKCAPEPTYVGEPARRWRVAALMGFC